MDLRQELMNYSAIDLQNLEEKYTNMPDNIKNSILLYNKAIDKLKVDSEDIAIIELKKAIAMNPEFHEAMNLLGLCYSYTGEYTRASELFEKVVAAENNSIKAMSYLNAIGTSNTQLVHSNKSKVKTSGENRVPISKNPFDWFAGWKDIKKNGKYEFGKYIIGFAAGVVLMLLVAVIIQFPKETGNTPIKDNSDSIPVVNMQKDYKPEYDELSKNYSALQDELKAADSSVDYYKSVVDLYEIEGLAAQKKYEEAADELLKVNPDSFKDTEKAKYKSIYSNVIPKAAWKVFTEGNNLFNQRKFKEAAEKLNKVLAYGDQWEYMPQTLYYLGKCYQEVQDSKKAVDAFQKIVDKYPKSEFAKWADMKIKDLTAQP